MTIRPSATLRRGVHATVVAAAASLLLAGTVGAAGPTTGPSGTGSVALTTIMSGYHRPVAVVTTGAHNRRIFIVEQSGKIKIASKDSGTWKRAGVFLDLSKVVDFDDSERGLLGMAFDPNYGENGLFYVDYTAKSSGGGYGPDTVVEYKRRTLDKADPGSARKVLAVPDPYENHNAGNLEFGPDGYLYVTEGDGGDGGDPGDRAQDLGVRLGKMLRIDPHDPDGSGPKHYTVPADNPFVGVVGAKPEIWALGLRNTWRWSFDRANGDLWLGDVGQCKFEEIDHSLASGGVDAGKGVNYGWNLVEGLHDFDQGDFCGGTALCSSNCQALPVYETSHASGDSADHRRLCLPGQRVPGLGRLLRLRGRRIGKGARPAGVRREPHHDQEHRAEHQQLRPGCRGPALRH